MNLLIEMYGNRNSVLKAPRKRLSSSRKIRDNLADFIKIQNELCCFKNAVGFYQDECNVVSGDFICTMVTKQFSVRNREKFTEHLKLDKTKTYLDELIVGYR